jgi:hypothetical protein
MKLTAHQGAHLQALAALSIAVFAGAGSAVLTAQGDLSGTSSIHRPTAGPAVAPSFYGQVAPGHAAMDVAPPQGCQALSYFASEDELRAQLGTLFDYGNYSQYGPYYGGAVWWSSTRAVGDSALTLSGPAPGHSTTNNQVGGVAELDTVQTDGYFIYMISGSQLIIVRSFPADQMQVVARVPLNGWASGLFLDGDRLAVVVPGWSAYNLRGGLWMDTIDALYPYWGSPSTGVLVFDVNDRSAPRLIHNYTVNGGFEGVRMIGDFLYLVTNYNLYLFNGTLQMPSATADGTSHSVSPREMGWLSGINNTTQLTSILSVNVSGDGGSRLSTFLSQTGGQIYVSPHNLYLLGSAWTWPGNGQSVTVDTLVSKFSFYRGEVSCYFTARVPGIIINQFSADEFNYQGEPHLRLVTTVRGSNGTSAGLYVLSETLERVGTLEDLAHGETVQSSRFMGERGYIVTFRRVDPLFVINLSDPAAPAVLGELTLPGFSQYLQPVDATHLLGIGVDATATGRATGLKLSLFDISDDLHPREVANYSFGANARSQAQYDHHALLWDPSRSLLVIPISTYTLTSLDPYSYQFWQGALAFRVTATDGFELIGSVAHDQVLAGTDSNGVRYSYYPTVSRALWIDACLYTISDTWLVATSLTHFEQISIVQIDVRSSA